MVIIDAEHLCMSIRGLKKPGQGRYLCVRNIQGEQSTRKRRLSSSSRNINHKEVVRTICKNISGMEVAALIRNAGKTVC